MTPRDIEHPLEEHSLGKGVRESAGDFEHVGDALARALDTIARGMDPTLAEIEAAAMVMIAKIMRWPLEPEAWSDAGTLPDDEPDPFAERGEAISQEALDERLKALAEMVPPTDPKSIEIYGIAANAGPRAARQAILDALSRGELSRNQANTLAWVLALGRL
ncbi:hypothetical protein [Inquilinus sp.]|uniref:hypothetical protein n=1 Tax=Inquilinus sp. TaxID=1932117 RepID=UPI0031D9854C